MPLAPGDLVLCSGTLPRHTPFRERLEAAVAGGYAAISLWGRDYRAARDEGYTDSDLVALVSASGLAVAEVDPAWWWTPGATAFTIPPELDPVDVFRYDEAELFRIGELFGARSLNVADVLGGSWSVEEGAAAFAGLCDRAKEHGLLVHLEWLAWSKIPDLSTAAEIVRLADRPNGGLNVDMWHCARTRTTADQLPGYPGTGCWPCSWLTVPPRPRTTFSRRRCTTACFRARVPSTSSATSEPSGPSALRVPWESRSSRTISTLSARSMPLDAPRTPPAACSAPSRASLVRAAPPGLSRHEEARHPVAPWPPQDGVGRLKA